MSVQNLRIRTKQGPVGLREKRKEPQKMTVPDHGEKIILSQWLKGEKDERFYHHCIKQAMLIGARYMDLNDAVDPATTNFEESEALKAKLKSLEMGNERIQTAGHKRVQMKAIEKRDMRERSLLIKYSKRCCCDRRERSFLIENGELVIYKSSSKNAKLCHPTYKMKDALVTFETRMPGTYPKPRFEEGFTDRIKCVFDDRKINNKSPFYLYPRDKEQLKNWKRAFQLARVLVSENDRRVLKISLGRCTSASLTKGWEAMLYYFKEIFETRRLVKQMALRLMKVEYSRGWSKMKLVNQKIMDDRKKRQEQQRWAARFMSEKLARIGTQNAKKATDVRETIITRIQQRFRHYRDEKIFDRQYPIGSKLVSRMRQARQGCQMDVALDMLTCKEVLKMSLTDPESLNKLKHDEILVTKKSTYSEVSIPAAEMLLSVSDNLQSLAFTAPTHTTDAWSHLTKSDWSNFVNLDRISQVVLHSAPHLAIKRKDNVNNGVWCTVYGPKVAWGKRIDIIENKAGKEIDSRSVGVTGADGFVVPKTLGQPFRQETNSLVRFVTVTVTIEEAAWNLEEGKPPSAVPVQRKIKNRRLSLHVLGYRFTSNDNLDENSKLFSFGRGSQIQAGPIPVAADDKALVCLDNSVIGVEITEISQAARNPNPREEPPEESKIILTGTDTLWNIFKPQEGQYKASYEKNQDYDLLLAPPELQEGAKAMGKLKVKVQVRFDNDKPDRNNRPVSPEFVGAGILTSLYTSHRGAWHDNELGPGQFRLDHVANFVELSLSGFRFDPTAKATDDGKTYQYRVRATLCGISTETPALHRAKSTWVMVLGPQFGDTNVIRFNGMRLNLPLPPGCFDSSKERRRPVVQLEIIQQEHEDIEPLSYSDFVKANGRARDRRPQPVVMYRTALAFDGCVVDQVKQVSAFFAKGTKAEDAVICDVWTNQVRKGKATEAVLNLDFALRDRDYIKSSMGNQDHPPSDYRTVCVGDKALMVWEEPILYPKGKQEFRSRFVPGTFKQGQDKWPADKGRDRGAPLRDPCVSSEYASSGLAEMVPRVPFKQSIIPNYCTDIIPHKFVLPFTEQQFLQDRRPGVYPWIVEDLAQKAQETGQVARGATPAKVQVTHLKYTTRKIPVLLLATYPDGTADIEVAPEFMEQWKREPERRYSLPGKLLAKSQEKPTPKVPQAKDAPPIEEPPIRAILQRTPLSALVAVHSAGFHVYDAENETVDDVLKNPMRKRGFNPRDANSSDVTQSDLESFSITAGPLPPDASPAACQYEWSLHVRAPNECEMHKFVAMLRQCVRVDHYQQAARMASYQSKQGEVPAVPQQFQRAAVGGQLEIVLVEARRLKANAMSLDHNIHEMKKYIPYGAAQQGPIHETSLQHLVGTSSGENSKSTPEGADLKTFVNFRMKHGDEVLAYKSQKVQSSEAVSGTESPSWANLEQLSASGGWPFKTGLIDPAKLNDLVIEFEVKQLSMGMTQRIGVIQLGVNSKPNLIDPKNPFRNLWIPLLHEPEMGVVQLHKTGEIHILTRWLPTEKLYLPPGQQQVTVRSQHLKDLWPKICAQRLKEPIYQLEALYLNYNPNLVRLKPPESPSHYVQRQTEDLHSTVPYLDCLDRRQNKEWKKFEDELAAANLAGQKLGELRVKWVAEHFVPGGHLHNLQELIEGGISCSRRERVWLDLTMASRVMEREGIGEPRDPNAADPLANRRAADKDYQRQLHIGLPQRSDANMQLQEDAFHLSAWESTTPPIAEFLDFHLRRLKAAQNVCTALIAYEKSGVAYCESLLIIAFFLQLPQGCTDQETNAEGEPQMYYMSESSAFWLLYTLVGTRVNGTFKEYYGRPEPVQPNPDEPARESLCVTSGAMHDVALLECCLAYHTYELWCHLNKLGFQLATVFYSAFMRLYATFLPTATVFRFWDILFSQSAHPKADPSGRSYLVDLAFGLLRAKKTDIMQCESALEVRQLILGYLGALYDTSTVVEITLSSHKFLWEGGGFSGGKIGHLWTQREELFRHQNDAFTEQNDILKIITHERPLGRIPLSKYESPPNTKGVMTKELLKDVLPAMQNAFETLRPQTRGTGRHWAMHRPMPLVCKALAENSVEKALNHMKTALKGGHLIPIPELVGPPEDPKTLERQKTPEDPKALNQQNAPKYPGMEPLDITAADMATVLSKDIPNWAQCGQHLWKSFTNRRDLYLHYRPNEMVLGNTNNPTTTFMDYLFRDPKKIELERQRQAYKDVEERISLNELFIALICCSRGTLGDKASCLFNLYSYVDQNPAPLHIQPIARLAKSITKTNEGSGEHMGKNLTPPEDELIRNNVLHLQIKSNYPQRGTLVGEVFVPTLGPFVGYNPNEAEATSYNIWGPNSGNTARFVNAANNSNAGSKNADPHVVGGDKVVVGDLEMALTWTPASIKRPEEGQLCIRLKSIRFYKMYVSEYFKMNPSVEVYTYRKRRKEVAMQKDNMEAHRIDRWDPRHMIGTSNQVSYITTGAYGGHIDFAPTMKEGWLGHGEHFRHWFRHGGDMGFHPDLEAWVWNETWGKQFSKESFVVEKEFMALSQRKNVMDIHGVRNIVTGILNRSMLNCTNRQALLIADTLFNRQGVVPGILEAVLVGGHPAPPPDAGRTDPSHIKWATYYGPDEAISLKKLKEEWTKNSKSITDVTNLIVLEHERQVQRFGFMNLFQSLFLRDWTQSKKKEFSLDDMGITGSVVPGSKTIWVRYVRSGDGERCTQAVLFESNGNIRREHPNPELKLDLQDVWPQTKVTKEEFISCMLNSSLLGESIRRIGATDHTLHQRKSIPLDVTVMDPHQEETDQLLSDAINIGQSICLEVWDADVASKDFLGECWLPPLASLSSVQKDYVFPLKNADFSEDAENGPSRESKHKELPADQTITGELYVKLAWKYPAYEMNATGEGVLDKDGKSTGEDVKDRAQIQEKLNTGRLTLQIIRAHHLRRADAAKGRDCDPQVTAYVRNDTLGQFRKKPLGRTGVVRNNRNPKWQGEFKDSPFDIMNGTYEARFTKKEAEGWFEEMKMALRGPMARRHQREDREMEAIKRYGTAGLKVKFIDAAEVQTNAGQQAEGGNHKVEIYLGDTIREFKSKLSQACDQECEHWTRENNSASAQKYQDVKISFKHLVMVFVPSPKVQRLYAQKLHEGAEYKHAYTLAIQDPSSWQPLDPTRTFGQYPQYGFGRKQPQLLRIVESSESYKLLNLRYKEFVKDQSKPLYQDTNTEERCYGWAKYWHKYDIGPTIQAPDGSVRSKTKDFEWRQAFIYKGSAAGTAPADMKYRVEWAFKPAEDNEKKEKDPSKKTQDARLEVRKDEVILAPRCPLVDAYVDPDHVEFLEQAKTYRQIGKSDWEIEVMLNKSLVDKYGNPPQDKERRIPNITVDIIRNYLQRSDATKAAGSATAPQTNASPSKGNQPPGSSSGTSRTPQGSNNKR